MSEDPRIWLEDVEGEEALDWVRERNAEAEAALMDDPAFDGLRSSILEVLEAEDRIAHPMVLGDPSQDPSVHNVWTDAEHRRGLVRTTSWSDYLGGDPEWDALLDVDALGEAEGESWVLAGWAVRRPDATRVLVGLSPGGSDASVTREYDLVERRFVPPEEGGFVRPLAKGGCTWIDDDTVYVSTDTGPGSLTRSGYPRTLRRWRRGTPLSEAELVFEGEESDISVGVHIADRAGARHHVVRRALDFYTAETHVLRDDDWVRVPVPVDVDVHVWRSWFLLQPRKPWTVDGVEHPGGTILVATVDGLLAGDEAPRALATPGEGQSIDLTWTRTRVVVEVLEHVRARHRLLLPPLGDPTDPWTEQPLEDLPDAWIVGATPVDADTCDDLLLHVEDLLTPTSLWWLPPDGEATRLRTTPDRFDASGLAITQHFATSADGTRIPYFQVRPTDAEGPGPTLLGGYGGFEVTRFPHHSPVLGRAWLAEGHTYVLANIRGGGEYGPGWHQAGLRENRPRVYEDFEAVARDLIDRGITEPSMLGCTGGSNGGLLVGNMYVRAPELWGAVVCQVPLLDMQRYHLLLAGASWMAEYGDPDLEADWAFLRTYSPYHLVDPDVSHPPILLTTSTRDDRVHPGHARKFAHLLADLGKDVTYWENVEGGHGGAADATQAATMQALVFTFLRQRLVERAA